MARRSKKEKVADPNERLRLKKLRAAERREARKRARESGELPARRSREEAPSADYSKPMVKDDYEWLRRSDAKAFALKIMNDHRERPYWVSIPRGTGAPPLSDCYPCYYKQVGSRLYYGFLFREHRDQFFARQDGARKETSDRIAKLINP